MGVIGLGKSGFGRFGCGEDEEVVGVGKGGRLCDGDRIQRWGRQTSGSVAFQ